MFDAAFIYVGEGLDEKLHRAVIQSPGMRMNVIGCADYDMAEKVAREMAAAGCTAIELCAGFGNEGTARIQRAVGPDIPVGAVKFDLHPALGGRSGDTVF